MVGIDVPKNVKTREKRAVCASKPALPWKAHAVTQDGRTQQNCGKSLRL
jgi:hypothetical protein